MFNYIRLLFEKMCEFKARSSPAGPSQDGSWVSELIIALKGMDLKL